MEKMKKSTKETREKEIKIMDIFNKRKFSHNESSETSFTNMS